MITVDGVALEWDGTPMTIYQFLSQKGVVVPCFCFHEKLELSGNCRMCLVEANGAVVVSCSVPLASPMEISTESERLSHSRENVLEFLLANHPLDCPICDQGGECDLQDISKTFGLDRGRFYESKRSVDNLNGFTSLVKTSMTRCIHCSRCVRFLWEYGDIDFFGLLGRGSSTEIGSLIQTVLVEEPLSGNIIDLCPVGALLSMPYSFTARPWELKSIESIDILDSMAGGVRFDVAHNKLMRCQPVMTEHLNEDWITNKARFVYYNLQRQQALGPSLRVLYKWLPLSWRQAGRVMCVENLPWVVRTGNFIDLETAALLAGFCKEFDAVGPSHESLGNASAAFPALYLFNSTLEELEQSSLILLIGCNLRKENPLLYLRLRRNYLRRRASEQPLTVLALGCSSEYDTFPVRHLGTTMESVELLLQGRLNGCKELFFPGFGALHRLGEVKHAHPKMIIGPGLLQLPQAADLQHRLWNFAAYWESLIGAQGIYNVALDYLGKLSMFAVNAVSSTKAKATSGKRLIWNFTTETTGAAPGDLVVYQGYALPSSLASKVDLFLPTAAPLEHQNFYLNLLGWVRSTRVVLSPAKTTYTDAQIVRFVRRFFCLLRQQSLSHEFPWNTEFVQEFEHFYGIRLEHNWFLSQRQGSVVELSSAAVGGLIPLTTSAPYYGADVFTRLSSVMTSNLMKCITSNYAF